jgi:hypothetical protein
MGVPPVEMAGRRGGIVDVRIGVLHTPKEIEVELPADADRADIRSRVDAALSGAGGVLWLTDRQGAEFAVPTDRIAWVQVGSADVERRIGFGS